MSEFNISVPCGNSKRLLTGGKFCPSDIIVTAEDEVCSSKHFVTEFMGNGQTSYTINIPFEPDMILLLGWEPMCFVGSNNAVIFCADLRSFSMAAGLLCVQHTGMNVYNTLMTTKSYKTRYSRAENGDITIKGLTISDPAITGVFSPNIKYKLSAVKYTDKTDKELITDFVNRLPSDSSGSVTMNQEKVNAAFTTAEWSALIATKPNWTFAMF